MGHMVKYDRVVLLQDVKHKNSIIPKNTVATLRDIVHGNVIIQYSYDKEPKYLVVPSTLLRVATLSDIETIEDYRNLVLKQYHLGTLYSLNSVYGDNNTMKEGVIISIDLQVNELNDIITLEFIESTEDYTKLFLDNHANIIELQLDEFNSDKVKTNQYVDERIEQYERSSQNV